MLSQQKIRLQQPDLRGSVCSGISILLILTPNYKEKAEKRMAGVGYEYSLITQELYEIQTDNNKFIPILRKGTFKTSAPGYIKTLLGIEMINDDTFNSDFFSLLREIYEKPKVPRPKIGPEPNFDEPDPDPIIERSKRIVKKTELFRKKISFLNSIEGVNTSWREITTLFQEIENKANSYKEKTALFFNAVHKSKRCILYGEENYCVNFYWKFNYPNSLDDAYLTITIWDSPLSLNNDYFDPNVTPNQLHGIIYKFNLDNDLKPIWLSEINEQYTTSEIIQHYFSLLLDFVITKKTEKL